MKTNWRWWICALLFVATTINYMDRQVLSLTAKEFIYPEFHWSDADYGTITGFFSIFYAVASLFAGKFIDWMGTRRGYLWAIFVWSIGACLHALCGEATVRLVPGIGSMAELGRAAGSTATLVATTSVYLFLFCRSVLALGESGNFPAAIKVTAEYFPKKDRALATSIFNAGASIGALAAPMCIPLLAKELGWQWAFVIIGALGFVWMFFWTAWYERPSASRRVNDEELAYINQDAEEASEGCEAADERTPATEAADERTIPFLRCFTYRQTWAFITGKFCTDGVWWFFLFWAPNYFQDQFGYKASSTMGMWLIFTLYLICTVLSIGGGYLPKYFVESRGMNPYMGRMRAMLIFAFFPIFALFAQPLGAYSAWWPAVIIGLAGAGHQAWSANLYSTIGDMFPRSTVATITGIGTMVGGIASYLINTGSGYLFDYASAEGSRFCFLSFSGKPAAYMIIFCVCALAYLVAWTAIKMLVPTYRKVE